MNDIVAETSDGVMRLRLNRARKKNALTRGMYDRLSDQLVLATEDDGVRCVVIEADGGDFCAGNDIFDFAQEAPALQADDVDLETLPVFRFLKALTFFEKPLVAVVQGQAVGVGVTLLLHCDLVVACDDARLSLPFLKLGLVPEAGSTLLLPERIGHARAFGWMALGETLGAEEARSMGLVNRVSDRAGLDAAVSEMTLRLCRLSPVALRHTKALMRDPHRLWQVVQDEGAIFRRLLGTPEALAAFSAFLSR